MCLVGYPAGWKPGLSHLHVDFQMNWRIVDVSEVTTAEGWFATRPWVDRSDADIDAVTGDAEFDTARLHEALHDWKRDGLVVFEKAIPHAAIDAMKEDMARFIEEPAGLPISLDVDGEMREMREFSSEELRQRSRIKFYALVQFSAAARELSLNPVVTSFLKSVFRDRPSPMSSLTFFRGSQQPPHADYAYVFRQKHLPVMAASWIPLEDIRPEAGPLAYYPGTHRVEEFGLYDFPGEGIYTQSGSEAAVSGFTQWLYRRLEDGGYEKKLFMPKKGDVLIWHAALVHEGVPIEDETATRLSHVTHFTSESCMPPDHVKRDKKGRPIRIDRGSGVIFQYPWLDVDFA